jgi:hypothetical protein
MHSESQVTRLITALADLLQMTVNIEWEEESKDPVISGSMFFNPKNVQYSFKLDLVDVVLTREDKTLMALVKVSGHLYLLVTISASNNAGYSTEDAIKVYVLDSAKLGFIPQRGSIQQMKKDEVVVAYQRGVVRGFGQDKHSEWYELEG